MTLASLLNITPNPVLSFLVWIVLALFALYMARKPFHRAVMSFSRIVRNGMRLSANSLLLAEKNLVKRNREVLMAAARRSAARCDRSRWSCCRRPREPRMPWCLNSSQSRLPNRNIHQATEGPWPLESLPEETGGTRDADCAPIRRAVNNFLTAYRRPRNA